MVSAELLQLREPKLTFSQQIRLYNHWLELINSLMCKNDASCFVPTSLLTVSEKRQSIYKGAVDELNCHQMQEKENSHT